MQSLQLHHRTNATPNLGLHAAADARATSSFAQTVLLKGVNDEVETMKKLVHRLLMMRVRPYYSVSARSDQRFG